MPRQVGYGYVRAGITVSALTVVTAITSNKGAAKAGRGLAIVAHSASEVTPETRENGGPATLTVLMREVGGGAVLVPGQVGVRAEVGAVSRAPIIRPSVMAAIATITAVKRSLIAARVRSKSDAVGGETAARPATASVKRGQRSGPPAIAAKRSDSATRRGTTAVKEGRAYGRQVMPSFLATTGGVKVPMAVSTVDLEAPVLTATVSFSQRIHFARRGPAGKVTRAVTSPISGPMVAAKALTLVIKNGRLIRCMPLTAWCGGRLSYGGGRAIGGQR